MSKLVLTPSGSKLSENGSPEEQKTGTPFGKILKKGSKNSKSSRTSFTRTVTKKGIVKEYKKYRKQGTERKFFVGFPDDKAMFPERLFDDFKQGDEIEFTGRQRGEWITVAPDSTATVVKAAPNLTMDLGHCKIRVGYISKERDNSCGKYVFSLGGEIVESENIISMYQPCSVVIQTALVDKQTSEAGFFTGYGVLEGVATFDPAAQFHITMTSISSFVPDIEQKRAEIPMSELDYGLVGVNYDIDGIRGNIREEDLPFDCSPVLNKVKATFGGTLIIVNNFKKRGRLYKEDNQWVEDISWISVGKPIFDFTACDIEGLEKISAQYVVDQKYRQLLLELKQQQTFQSVSDIQKRFDDEGVPITQEEIVKMFYHEGYDPECFEILDAIATDRFVTHKDFIFLIEGPNGETRYIWETPSVAAATYVFDDTLPKEQLLSKVNITGRMNIRRSKEVQQTLGFLGFVIHQDHSSWRSRVKFLLGKNTTAVFEKTHGF